MPPSVGEGFHANASRNPVSGLVALACELLLPGTAWRASPPRSRPL
ncbi:hypothetical protein LTSEMIN_5933, partial [Salmonella enterica subsp. enterica serovar Minnesota str. A4-603]